MVLKVRSGWAFLLVLVVVVAMVIPNWGPVARASTQAQIVTAMGAGWNCGNQLECNDGKGNVSETAWNNGPITQNLFTTVKNAGFKTVRIPFSLLSKIGPGPSYTIDAAWLARIKEVVDYAYGQGLYVLIDLHGDGYTTVTGGWLLVTSSDQTTIRAKFKAVWQQIANVFKDYDEHLIFESMNEVFDGDWDDPLPAHYANFNAYNQIFVDTVRQTGGNNASRWLLIPGWNTNIDFTVGDYGFVVPTDNYRSASIPSNEKRIMISDHYYSPWEFCGDTGSPVTQWGAIATDKTKVATWGGEDYMDAQLKSLYYQFATQGYPIVIGEYSATDKTDKDSTNDTYRAYFAKTLSTDCKKYGAVPVYWDNGYNGSSGCAIFDRNTYATTEPGILTSIMSGIGANVTPPPPATPAPTPTPLGPGAKITILYKCNNTNDTTNGLSFSVQVRNDDTVTIPLADVFIRYWYTRDSGQGQVFNCDYSGMGSGTVTGTMVRMPLAAQTSTADYYGEIGFTSGAGSLAPGATSGEAQIRLTQSNYSSFIQTNDYSFNASQTSYGVNLKVTGYFNGVLEFGTEPSGIIPPTTTPTVRITATPTSRQTPTPSVSSTPTPTRRGPTPTPTRRVTPTPTRRGPTATPTPTRRVTPTPTPPPPTGRGGYAVTYTISSDWGSGANADVTIKNNTTNAVNGWTLAWTFPGNQSITNLWGGAYTQSGTSVSVKDAGYNSTIGANGGTTSFGFGMNYSGTNAKPTGFSLNGTACTLQ